MIKEKIINFIHRNEIDDEKYLTDGGSSVIMTAKWIRNNTNIALKDVAINEKTDTDNDEFIKEIKIIEIVHSNKDDNENKEKISSIGYKNVINFFGLTGDKSGLYLVYEYADLGNLRYYLSQNNLGWKQKVNIARQTVCGLYFLQENKILHRDLNTQNVVMKMDKNFEGGIRTIIIDFGFSKVLSCNSNSNQLIELINGSIPFLDPARLNDVNYALNYKSDIYSLGVIMWEITSNGRPPFNSIINNNNYSLKKFKDNIIKGAREEPINGSTISYIELYQGCWNEKPNLRPEIKNIHKSIYQEDMISGKFYGSDIDQAKPSEDSHGFYNMVLQYAEDGTLREYLMKNLVKLKWADKLRIAKEIAHGLSFLHDNDINHRDLHSKNILIHEEHPKIADFGLSKQMNETSMTSTSNFHGMLEYMEPQCFNNINDVYKRDKRSDIYSFGVILWEISSGRPPFQTCKLTVAL
ncbi:kinase-like domain-containing protein [Gigaspora rosea]|uniref:Kinase-like domain-containing protein n=1 Tax=Gigaspora rosea TaxID=44941 RepID=A0A397UCR1_9GLOM|nr:kinase-like domain-containing protein [Gigaspora rosea]